jgi:signal transduction histidine kinase
MNDLSSWSLSSLEKRRADINRELTTLARYSIRSGTGVIGYRSKGHTNEVQLEWVEIDLRVEAPLDEVVLVPVIRRDADNGFQADGFPKRFRLIAGTSDNPEGTLIAEYTNEQQILPRTAPLLIPCNETPASWIRIEADRLSLRDFDEQYVLQLSEIMAFSGDENIALQSLARSRTNRRDGLAWELKFLTDGSVPYLMDAATGEKSVAFLSRSTTNTSAALTIDLEKPYPISGLHLHAVDTSDLLPQALPSNFAIPKHMLLEGANQPDFSDATPLLELHMETLYDTMPVMMWSFPKTTNRFFRLNMETQAEDPRYDPEPPRFGFAEIELLAAGKNVALGRPVTGTEVTNNNPRRPLSQLTDGRNMYGTILPTRDWMEQLSRRHDLETQLPLVEQELKRRYEKQKGNLQRLGWLSTLLTAGIGFTILIDRLLRMREVRRIEQRLAADLHDELGANLHTIGLLSDLAESSKEDPDELAMLHQRIRTVTERSGVAVRNCTRMFSSSALHKGLVTDMKRAAQRTMARLDHDFSIEGEEYIRHLNRKTCFDLFLFYKESLINISRHSGATRFATRLIVSPKNIQLTIHDNGRGLPEGIPASLKRRARLLGANVVAEKAPEGGACIRLTLRLRRKQRNRS